MSSGTRPPSSGDLIGEMMMSIAGGVSVATQHKVG